ncbi:solute carrier family 23 member 1-like isoform X2 [Diadema antillarum]|uniref:solute carrier family 23 member 1-like isoform X2 n=1 Tax=Diadema antillarum TaxID=105358 RepID=UPI003A86E431
MPEKATEDAAPAIADPAANEEKTNVESNGQDQADVAYQKYSEPEDGGEEVAPEVSDAQAQADAILNRLKSVVTYGIEDNPPWYTTIILSFQHFLTMFSGVLAIPLILSESLCLQEDLVTLSKVIGTIFFVSGLVTVLQSTFGVRLPIIQGGTFAFLLPTFSILQLKGDCPTLEGNATITEIRTEFRSRIQEIQGAVIVASIVQVVIGFTGIMGLLLRYIGPLAIAPTIGLIGLSLFKSAAAQAQVHWGIAWMTMILIIMFSQYLERFSVPCLGYSKAKKCHVTKFPVFKLFPIIIAILIAWFFSFILTVTDVFPTDPNAYGYKARTDINSDVLREAPWFYFPYPGQWGTPRVTAAGTLGMLAGVLASMLESVGDYYACARLSGAPPPPPHAINRGIGMEGLGCILAGAWGTGNGTTSYSENIGAIGITKVGSRIVIQGVGCILMIVGVFGKFGAFFSTIPDPIIGGVLSTTFGMVAAVGISNLQFVDLNSPRNLFIIGFSFYVGIAIPDYVVANQVNIKTGNETFDQVIVVLLETSMFVGGAVGFILDNTVPGTPEERGLTKWRDMYGMSDDDEEDFVDASEEVMQLTLRSYEMPFGMKYLRKWEWTRYIPFSPTFAGFHVPRRVKQALPKGFRKRKAHDDIPMGQSGEYVA